MFVVTGAPRVQLRRRPSPTGADPSTAAPAPFSAAAGAAAALPTEGPAAQQQQQAGTATERRGLLLLDRRSVAWATATMMYLVIKQPPAGRALTAATLAVWLAELALVMLCPKFHQRNRSLCFVSFRIIINALPSQSSSQYGAAAVMMGAPHPGVLGALLDLLLVFMGTRLLSITGQGTFLKLPPAYTLILQGYMLAMTWNLRGYCSTPLLRHPLSQQRIARVAAALELFSLPVVALMPAAGYVAPFARQMSGQAGNEEAICRATLSYFQLLTGMLPFFLSLRWWQPGLQPPGPHPAPAAQPSHTAAIRCRRARQRMLSAVSAFVVKCDHVLYSMLHMTGQRALAATWLLMYAWLLCKLAVGLA